MHRLLSVLTLLVSFVLVGESGRLAAQTPGNPPGGLEQQYSILGISVVGNRSGDAATIISQSGLFKGESVTLPSDAKLRAAISQLWALGIFRKVDIVVEKQVQQADGSIGLFLGIHVSELPHLGKDTIIGNKDIKTADIEKALSFHMGDFVRPWELASARNRVKAKYEKEGYHFATVNVEQIPGDDSSSVDLRVTINEGSEMIVRHIDFVGNDRVSSGDLRSAMDDTKEKKWYKIFSSCAFDQKKYDDDKKKLIDYYHSKGYRDVTLTSDSVWTTGDNDLSILIHLYEGPQFFVRDIAVVGAEVFPAEEVRSHLGFHKGDIYDMVRLETSLHGNPDFTDVGSLYYDRGYLANVGKEETVVAGDSIDLTIRIQEGKQHFFRYVDVKGNTKTKDYVVRRELFTRPGDPFSRSAVVRSLRQLAALNYFNQEKLQFPEITYVPDATDVDVTYSVEERSSDTFNASIGYGGVLGLTGSIGVSFNNFDITDPLHGGGGEVLSVTAEIGASAYRTVSVSFSEPWLNQRPTSLGVSLYTTHSEYVYTADRTGAALTLGRRFRWPDDFFRVDWTLAAQHANITNGGGIYTVGIHDETSIQQTISRVSTDNPVFPTTGSEFAFMTRIAYLPIASIAPNQPANYFKNNFTMKFFTPLLSIGGQNKLVLMTSSDIGQLGGVANTPYVPPTELFVMGGSGFATGISSVPLRGYDDASIGVQKGTATTSIYAPGGLAYSRYVAELRFILSLEPIPIYFLTFAEAGNVWADFTHADLFDLKRSAGVGARVQVPAVGMIGIDFGYGFDSRSTFGSPAGWHTHFQFGRGF